MISPQSCALLAILNSSFGLSPSLFRGHFFLFLELTLVCVRLSPIWVLYSWWPRMYHRLHVLLLNPPYCIYRLKQVAVGAKGPRYHGFTPCAAVDWGMISRATHGEPFRYTWQEIRDGEWKDHCNTGYFFRASLLFHFFLAPISHYSTGRLLVRHPLVSVAQSFLDSLPPCLLAR